MARQRSAFRPPDIADPPIGLVTCIRCNEQRQIGRENTLEKIQEQFNEGIYDLLKQIFIQSPTAIQPSLPII